MKNFLAFIVGILTAIVFYFWKVKNYREIKETASKSIATDFHTLEEDEKKAKKQFKEAVKEKKKEIEKAESEKIKTKFEQAFGIDNRGGKGNAKT